MGQDFWEGFVHPPRICTQSPFWFLNDRVDGAVYAEQVSEMAAKGVMQVMPHPRYGMDRREYLTDHYMDAFSQMVEKANELGMTVNLYDDFNWSSGQCGGRITGDRHKCALGLAFQKAHTQRAGEVTFSDWTEGFMGWADFETVLLAGWAPYRSETEIDASKMVFAEPEVSRTGCRFQVPEGDLWAFVLYEVRTQHESPLREGNGGIVDYLSADATAEFIRLTHERYFARLGVYFGGTIQSIFSDEVGPYACGDFTWTEDFLTCFLNDKGYDLLPRLPLLYFDGDPAVGKTRCDYWDEVSKLYQTRFMRPIADWCSRHGIASTGHSFEESRLWMVSANFYESMRTQRWVGVDSLLGYKPYSMLKPAVSVAHVTGRRDIVCEAVGVIGENIGKFGSWTCSPRQVKYAYNQLGIAGITVMVPHAFFQSVDNPKVECPPSFFKDNYYWRYYWDIERLTEIMCYVNRTSAHVADVAVYYPIVSWWALSRGGRGRGMPTHIPERGTRDYMDQTEAYDAVIDGLMRRLLDQDVLDLQALQETRVENGMMLLQDERYRALVLPPLTTERMEFLKVVNRLIEEGVPVFAMEGFHPTSSMERGEEDAEFRALAERICTRISFVPDVESLERFIRGMVECDMTLLEGDRDSFDAAHRRRTDMDIYLFSNLCNAPNTIRLRLRAVNRHVALLDSLGHLLDKGVSYCRSEEDGRHTVVQVTLPPEELCYLFMTAESCKVSLSPLCSVRTNDALACPATWLFSPAPAFDGTFPYRHLPLQKLIVPVGKTCMLREASGDVCFIKNWMQPAFDDSAWERVTLKRGSALFSHKNSQFFRFVIPTGSVALRMPFPSPCEFSLYVNGEQLLTQMDDQGEEECWLPIKNCEDKPGLLAVETASMRPDFGLTSGPVFLLKPFRTRARDWRELGLEWYSGFAVYEAEVEVDHAVYGPLWLDLGDVRECCEVWVNEQNVGHRIWPPYVFDVGRALVPGKNQLKVAVCNLMSNEYTWDVIGSRGTGRYLPSGIISDAD